MKINQKHTKDYFRHFDLPSDPTVFVACELCGKRAADIHHIDARGMGGTTHQYDIKELMALCTQHHHEYGDIKVHKKFLTKAHLAFLDKFQDGMDYEYEFLPKIKFPLENK